MTLHCVNSLRAGFEPARGIPIGFQVQRLNHSAIAACCFFIEEDLKPSKDWRQTSWKAWQNGLAKCLKNSTFCLFMKRSHGVMVSTLDFESSDPSSSLGGTCKAFFSLDILTGRTSRQ